MSSKTPKPEHLVIVCCHGVWVGGPARGHDENEWLIANFQKGETPTFIEHIKAGLRVMAEDDRAELFFSGGPTRPETRITESQSYAKLARDNDWFGIVPATAAGRIHVELKALDSYYNVLFSVLDFWDVFEGWPRKITIVSHAFKRERLVDCHCAAIGFPLDRVDFVGIDPPGMIDGTNEAVIKGITEAIAQWEEDPHGRGELLAEKRRKRNPWGISQTIFWDEGRLSRSGVRLGFHETGEAYLLDGHPQPWSRCHNL